MTAERNRIRNRGPQRWYIMTDSWARAQEYKSEAEAQVALDELNAEEEALTGENNRPQEGNHATEQ